MGNLVATLREPATDVINMVIDDIMSIDRIYAALKHWFGMTAQCDLV